MWPFRNTPTIQTTISVVMPSFEQGRFIRAAVRSVLEQKVEGLEIVIVDGGSTDDTLNHLVELSCEFPNKIRWSSIADTGPAQAVNRAVGLARGSVIGWLNSDDLYAPGSIARATEYFQSNPSHIMVYGEGTHIDEAGTFLEAYPTRGPGTPIDAFADGCFICQPTAFFRRDAFIESGGLDESLRAAFDFDLWVRFFKQYPGKIGQLQTIQALSRLHDAGITLKQRKRVALEGMAVIRRHLGPPPAHWLLTHFAELSFIHPFHQVPDALTSIYQRLIDEATPLVDGGVVEDWNRSTTDQRQVQLSSPSMMVDVYPDGWAGRDLDIRLRQPVPPISAISLLCMHVAPSIGVLRLLIISPDQPTRQILIEGHGPFEIDFDVSDMRPDARIVFRVRTEDYFVPFEVDGGSEDSRQLAFMVETVECRSSETRS